LQIEWWFARGKLWKVVGVELTVLERGPVAIGFNAVFFAVREAFLVILGLELQEGPPFAPK
jgi:hypothetical protein